MTTQAPSKTQICFHESAHAVIATALELPVYFAKARQDGEQFGCVRLFGSARECDGWKHIVMSMAGREAARRVTKEDVAKHATSDLEREAALLLSHPEDDREAMRASLETLTTAYVDRHWAWIERTARELLRNGGFLTGSQIKALRD